MCVAKNGGRLAQRNRPFPEWRQRVDTSKGMSILG